MAYEVKPNSGSLFKNKKRESETHANATGSAMIKCPHCDCDGAFYIDAWTNEKDDGERYQNLRFKPKKEQPRGRPAPKPQPKAAPATAPPEDDGDDVPF